MSLGFDVLNVLHQGKHSVVYRAKYKKKVIILKTHPLPFGTPSEIEQLEKEFKIGRLLCHSSNHIAKYLQIIERKYDTKRKAVAIVMEDTTSQTLANAIPTKGFQLPIFLDIVIF